MFAQRNTSRIAQPNQLSPCAVHELGIVQSSSICDFMKTGIRKKAVCNFSLAASPDSVLGYGACPADAISQAVGRAQQTVRRFRLGSRRAPGPPAC